MPMRRGNERLEVVVRAVVRLDLVVVRDVVPVITRRLGHRHEPDAVGAKAGDVVELLRQSAQIADAVTVRVVERTYEDFIAHRGVCRLQQGKQNQGIHSKLPSIPSAEFAPTNTRNVPGSTTGFMARP